MCCFKICALLLRTSNVVIKFNLSVSVSVSVFSASSSALTVPLSGLVIVRCRTFCVLEMDIIVYLYDLYWFFLAVEPSPLHTTTLVEKCTLKLVDEYKHMLCQATEPLSTFLEYIT